MPHDDPNLVYRDLVWLLDNAAEAAALGGVLPETQARAFDAMQGAGLPVAPDALVAELVRELVPLMEADRLTLPDIDRLADGARILLDPAVAEQPYDPVPASAYDDPPPSSDRVTEAAADVAPRTGPGNLTTRIAHPAHRGQPFDRAMQDVFDMAGWDIDMAPMPGWESLQVSNRGFGPDCAILHWAASADGRDGGLPKYCRDRVLCHLLLSGELHGSQQRRRVYLISQNRTGHAGECSTEALATLAAERTFPYQRWPSSGGAYNGYYRSVGMEVTASGTKPYPAWLWEGQYQTYAALFYLFGWGPRRLGTHAQITSRKVDCPDTAPWAAPTYSAQPWPAAGARATTATNQTELARWLDVLNDVEPGPSPVPPPPQPSPTEVLESDSDGNSLLRMLVARTPAMKGADVTILRQRFRGPDDDGSGGYTEWFATTYVRPFQQANGLTPDGIVGPKTWTAALPGGTG